MLFGKIKFLVLCNSFHCGRAQSAGESTFEVTGPAPLLVIHLL